MERQAALCDRPALRADLLSMAESWRHVAIQALWQDRRETAKPVA